MPTKKNKLKRNVTKKNRVSLCASCLQFSMDKILKSKDKLKPSWLTRHDYVRDFISKQTSFSIKKPNKYDTVMELHLGKQNANKKILYWGADPKSLNSISVKNAKDAYNKFHNNGIAKADSNGNVCVHFLCPQLYKTTPVGSSKPQTYFRHLHFVYANNDQSSWLSQIFTKIVVCKIKYNNMKTIINSKNKHHVLINALPCKYYAKDHIPNSFNLFNKDVAKMSVEQLHQWFKDVIKINYPLIYQHVKSGKIQIYEIPIITYCAHDKCNASELTVKELMKKGFVNIHEYSGGMKDYRKHNPTL